MTTSWPSSHRKSLNIFWKQSLKLQEKDCTRKSPRRPVNAPNCPLDLSAIWGIWQQFAINWFTKEGLMPFQTENNSFSDSKLPKTNSKLWFNTKEPTSANYHQPVTVLSCRVSSYRLSYFYQFCMCEWNVLSCRVSSYRLSYLCEWNERKRFLEAFVWAIFKQIITWKSWKASLVHKHKLQVPPTRALPFTFKCQLLRCTFSR